MRTRMTLWIKIRMMKMMRLMMTMLPRSAAPLEEAWEEHLARWEPTGTGSCGVVLYAGEVQLICRFSMEIGEGFLEGFVF